MAEANVGDVLFQRGQTKTEPDEEEEDIWDDSALIKAYDDAVSLMKHKVAVQNGSAVPEHSLTSTTGKQKSKKRSKKNKKKRKWKVGDLCRAKFSEDGLVYEAEILSLDEEADTCYVRYTGYGNEEEQKLSEVMCTKTRRRQQESDLDATDSGADRRSSHSSVQHGSAHLRHRARSTDTTSIKHPSFWSAPAPPPPDPGIPHFAFPGFSGFPSFPSHPSQPYQTSARIPPIPPPPPPPMCGDMSESDNEAMCSMLMAWYMSGYHTGYYQGLQQGKRESSASSPYVNR